MAKDLFNAPEFLELIDWHDITASICSHACFAITRAGLSSCHAFIAPAVVEIELKKQDILHQLATSTQRLASHLSRLGDDFLAGVGKDLSKGRVPTLGELHRLALLIEADEIWQTSFMPELGPEQLRLTNLPKIFNSKIITSLREFISDDGSINERGFKEMRLLTDELLKLEAEARRRAQELKNKSDRHYGESGEFDIINDRYVLPVPSDRYNASCGQIIHRSRTGMTLLVEPPEMRPFSLRRSELLAQRDWLIFKKCRELGEMLLPYCEQLNIWSEFALEFDRLQCLAQWARQSKLCRPDLCEKVALDLRGLFHPLVENCVTNDIQISNSSRGIILSGPNTGGKTVLLKSVALCAALIRIGSWVPCQSAQVYPYNQLYFFSHDLQDIGAGLSSFSSEVKNYSALVDEIQSDALVIIDEIFNSTSSEEASALAVALLEHLEELAHPHILLSTHHHGIKTTTSTMDAFRSCHMAVDAHGVPLYQIIWGSPGSSRGIDTFNRLTQETKWGRKLAKRAKTLLGSQVFDYESALTEINAQRAQYLLKQNEADAQIIALKNEHAAFQLQKNSILQKQQSDLLNKYEMLVDRAQGEIDRLKQGTSSVRRTLDTLASGKRELKPYQNNTQKIPERLVELPLRDLEGLKVWSRTLGKSGIVQQVKGNKLLVDFKGMKSWSARSDLQLQADQQQSAARVNIHIQREVLGKTSLDGRGQRLEAFQSDVLVSLQELLSGDVPFLDIIHGHGNGILKKWLRQHLNHENDFQWAPLDGNDGATRVEIKK